MHAVVALLALLQQDQTVFRKEKQDYIKAVERCKEAQALVEADPRAALERLDEIIGNPKIKVIECRLRIEDRPGDYLPAYDFLPYQYRGRAFLALARKDPANAARHLARAAEDFRKSNDLGVASSQGYLKTAEAEAEKLRAAAAAPPSPREALEKFRPAWESLLAERKFKSARALLDARKEIPEADRARLIAEAERQCRAYLAESVLELRDRLGRAGSLQILREMEEEAAERLLRVPLPSELVATHPVLQWAGAHGGAFPKARAGRFEALLAAAAAAAPLEDRGENFWFAVPARLAAEGLAEPARDAAGRSLDAPKAERERLKSEAEARARQWESFAGGFSPAFRKRHPFLEERTRELRAALQDFPADLPELETLDIGASFDAADPREALRALSERLRRLDGGGASLAIESRRRLYSAIVTVEALRAFAAGKSEEEAAREVAGYADRLRQAGGPLDPRRYGPRVERVFEKLR